MPRNGPVHEGGTHYELQHGEYGEDGLPYRLNVDFDGVLIAFDRVTFAGGMVMLYAGETGKATLHESRLPSETLDELREIAEADDA